MKSLRVRWLVAGLAASLAALLAACAGSVPAPTLVALPSAAASPTGSAGHASAMGTAAGTTDSSTAAPVLVVRRLDLPEYLVARRVRYRADAATIGEWPNTFWAERFEIGMTREFTDAVRQQLPGWVVCETTCGERVPALSLQVELVPLDFWRSELQLRARARMSVSGGAPGDTPPPPKIGEQAYELVVANDTPQAYAQSLAELLRAVARPAADMVKAARQR
jgi:uncharacterized lipoprotein YmbA